MATRIKPPPKPLYEQDFYAWAKAQADLLRAGRYAELDLDHLTLEVDDLGDSCIARLRRGSAPSSSICSSSSARLRPSRGPDGRGPSEHSAPTSLTTSCPSLRPRIEANLPRFYEIARIEAAAALRAHSEHAAADALPATCPTRSSKSPATGCRERSAMVSC